MVGFKVKFRQEVIHIGPVFLSSIYLYQKYGRLFIDIGASIMEGREVVESVKWLESRVYAGEEVEITVVDDSFELSSKPIRKVKAYTEGSPMLIEEKNEFHERLFQEFQTLEKLLKKEGLIQ